MLLVFQMMVCRTDISCMSFTGTDCEVVSLPASFNVWLASPEARFLKSKFLWANWDVDELKTMASTVEDSMRFSIGLGGWPFGNSEWKEGAMWS